MNDTDRALAALAARVRHLETLEYQDAADIYPIHATMWFDEAEAVSGNAVAISSGTVPNITAYAMYAYQLGPYSDGDSAEISFHISAGTYDLSILGWTSTNRGIVDVYVDGVLVGSSDWYSNPTVFDVVVTYAGVVIATSGNHTLTITVNGKNVASSDYQWSLIKAWIA